MKKKEKREKSKARKFSRILWVLISSVILLVFWTQWLVQHTLFQQKEDSSLINIAGRQRMLSQRLVNRGLQFQLAPNPQNEANLQSTRREFQEKLGALQNGDLPSGTHFVNSTEVRQLYASMQPSVQGLMRESSALLNAERPQDLSTQAFVDHGEQFLEKMEKVVAQYNEEARAHVGQLQVTEILLAFGTVAIILFQVLLFYRPLMNKLHRSNQALAKKNQALESYAHFTNHNLRKPIANILGLSMHIEPQNAPNPEDQEALTQLKSEAEKLDSIIRENYQIIINDRNATKT